jgi:nicotinic acid mononucleotide adenylyltransferase
VESAESLLEHPAGAILVLEVDAPDCSSSGVRAALDSGEIPLYCLHPDVADYIRQHRIYRSSGD